jgi:hypothetical protein
MWLLDRLRGFMWRDEEIKELCERILARDIEIGHKVDEIWARLFGNEPTALGPIIQISEDNMPTNDSIVAGQSGVFQGGGPLPAGSAFAPGVFPTWAASDPSIALSAPAGITDGSQINAAVPAGNTAPFTLQQTYVRVADGVLAQSPALTVTVVAGTTPPPSNEPTSLGPITQLS